MYWIFEYGWRFGGRFYYGDGVKSSRSHVYAVESFTVRTIFGWVFNCKDWKYDSATQWKFRGEKKYVAEINKTVKKARKKFAIVTVANGSGIIEIFKDLGADVVIDGGQTNNPSSQAFIDAFEEVNADCIFVLPNNSNIILTAKQAGEMYQGSDVRVIPSKSVGDGYAALSMLDFSSEDADLIERNMVDDMASVVTGMVSQAVRTTTVNGVDVKKDEYIGFTNKKVLLCSPDKICSAIELTEKLMTDDKMFIIVCYGKGASSENRQAYSQYVNEKFKEKEIYEINGEQAVYDFLLIVE